MIASKRNRLADETSPYLLQHANNPVDWYPWGDAAIQKAKTENKPILVSIGYAACHWCHVMERESFENEATAEIMNERFVNIKIDREERPDLDHIYMDAVQAMTGSGGWPLNVFLTPDCKPFFGGTYFPPTAMFNRPSWQDVLEGVSKTYREKPEEIANHAETLTTHLVQANHISQNLQTGDFVNASKDTLNTIYANIMKSADRAEGGFGKAPKFPQTFTIHNLFEYYQQTKNEEALQQACLSLDKMIYGGIYDQIGGGFSRYSTDSNWLVPHFEKMLYDNALLLMVLSEAWQLTHKDVYKLTIERTIAYIEREMLSPENGFYSALDADSEGEEGKFYVWDRKEIESVLLAEADMFCEFYGVTNTGNWESKNILNVPVPPEEFAVAKGINLSTLHNFLNKAAQVLLEQRNKRVRPLLDDKILLGWNALMNTALSKAYGALGNDRYKEMAVDNMKFLLDKFADQTTGGYFHTYKSNNAKYPAFLDDYANLIRALINLQEITGDEAYLNKANELTGKVIEGFSDDDGVMFYYTNKDQKDIVVRKIEIYDGAVPSGNASMAWNLLYLQLVYDRKEWNTRVVKMLNGVLDATVKYPTSFGLWTEVLNNLVVGINELVVTGDGANSLLKQILHIFMPNKVLQVSAYPNDNFPLLKGKDFLNKPLIYLCKDYACQAPLSNVESLIRQLGYIHAYN